MASTYTLEEVSCHDNAKDLWIVIHGGVYDLTKFLKEHPGGEEVLMNLAGKDGTTCFDDIGHSAEAVKLCESFRIGDMIVGGTGGGTAFASNTGKNEKTVDDDDWEYEEPKKEPNFVLPVIIAFGVLVYAVLIYYLYF